MIKRVESQLWVADRVRKAFEDGAETVYLEAPTGYGKSGISYFIQEKMKCKAGVYSHQKVLQDQYLKLLEGEQGTLTIKGAANYTCMREPDIPVPAAPCNHEKQACPLRTKCEYFRLRALIPSTQFVNANYQMVMSVTTLGSPEFGDRIAIFDECHNVPEVFRSFKTVELSSTDARKLNKQAEILDSLGHQGLAKISDQLASAVKAVTSIPEMTEKQAFPRFRDIYERRGRLALSVGDVIAEAFDSGDQTPKHKALGKLLMKEQQAGSAYHSLFIEDTEQGRDPYAALETQDTRNQFGKDVRTHSLIPIDISKQFSKFAGKLGEQRVFMSSTIFGAKRMNTELGLPGNFETIVLDSPFPVENRKIYSIPVKYLNNKVLYANDDQLDGYFDTIADIIESHVSIGESGIIFAPSYKLTKLLVERLESKIERMGAEVIYNTSVLMREQALDKFRNRETITPKVLISPSFAEGVNFNDDLSRFQIISKVPYLSLGSNYVKKRMGLDPKWYSLEAAKQVVQTCGRSVRSKEDRAMTYIVDGNWKRVFGQVQGDLPEWFKEAVENVG